MNKSIVRLFAVVVLMFAILVGWTSRWTVFDASSLDANPLNSLQKYAALTVRRGSILADDGTVLAQSVKRQGGVWGRVYPNASLFSQAVGYYFPEFGQTGLESARDRELKGSRSQLTWLFGSTSAPTQGADVRTSLDPKAQALARQEIQHAMSAVGATSGSVVAIVPQTGAIKVMYSSPSYNDNLAGRAGFANRCVRQPHCSEVFDATQGRYPPGSTFKLITTAAALDSGRYTPASVFNGDSPVTISGHTLENDNNHSYGPVSLTAGLTYSINTVYAPLGLKLGARLMQKYMRRFGFYAFPPLDFPRKQMIRSGELFYKPACGNRSNLPKLVPVTSPCVDLGRTAIGQANLAVSPLQMAMVVSAIANDGKLMQPRLTSSILNNLGQTVEKISPEPYDQVMKPRVAAELQHMMRDVVDEGTALAANLAGYNIGGKTGTASTGGCSHGPAINGSCPDGQPLDDAWFVGFPESNPKIAIAVELSDIPNGFGGTYAAPIAASVIRALVRRTN
jgi:peptidoglycan glycosyltransferase